MGQRHECCVYKNRVIERASEFWPLAILVSLAFTSKKESGCVTHPVSSQSLLALSSRRYHPISKEKETASSLHPPGTGNWPLNQWRLDEMLVRCSADFTNRTLCRFSAINHTLSREWFQKNLGRNHSLSQFIQFSKQTNEFLLLFAQKWSYLFVNFIP